MRFYRVAYNGFEGQKSSIIITWYNSKVKLKLLFSHVIIIDGDQKNYKLNA
jgi:hypothetical protein